jgi:predicted ATPase
VIWWTRPCSRRSHEALLLAQEVSHPPSLAAVLFYVAFIHCYRRDAPATQEQAEAAMALASAQGLPQWLTVGQLLRGWALAMQGQAEEGLRLLAEALVHVDTTGEAYWAVEVYGLKGELLWRQAIPDEAQAEACLHQTLGIARRQQTRSWELRAAVSLVRLWQQQGKRAEAHALLAPIYGWFTEGFDTVDLQEARALLEELEG